MGDFVADGARTPRLTLTLTIPGGMGTLVATIIRGLIRGAREPENQGDWWGYPEDMVQAPQYPEYPELVEGAEAMRIMMMVLGGAEEMEVFPALEVEVQDMGVEFLMLVVAEMVAEAPMELSMFGSFTNSGS